MGYREIIPPERLEEFEAIGESEVQAKLDAGLYSGRHQDAAILFIKLCESEREPDKQTPEIGIPWHETSWGISLIALAVTVIGGGVLYWIGWTLLPVK